MQIKKSAFGTLFLILFLTLGIDKQTNAQIFTKEPGIFQTFKLYGGVSAEPSAGIAYVEPQMSLTDALQIGYRYQYFFGQSPNYRGSTTDALNRSAHLITFEYIGGIRSFRPFANIGIGSVTSEYLPNRDDDKITDTQSSFIFTPKIGFNVGAFRLGIGYNFAKKTKYDIDSAFGLNMELAIRLWGRQKTILIY